MHKPFNLPTDMRIYQAHETRDAMLAWMHARSPQGSPCLEISARDVLEIDGCGLQLLAALSNQERHWRLVDASEAFSSACLAMGFGHWLDQCDRTVVSLERDA